MYMYSNLFTFLGAEENRRFRFTWDSAAISTGLLGVFGYVVESLSLLVLATGTGVSGGVIGQH